MQSAADFAEQLPQRKRNIHSVTICLQLNWKTNVWCGDKGWQAQVCMSASASHSDAARVFLSGPELLGLSLVSGNEFPLRAPAKQAFCFLSESHWSSEDRRYN